MKTLFLLSLGVLAIPVGAATISSGTIAICQSGDGLCQNLDNSLTASFDVSGSSLTHVEFSDRLKSFSILFCFSGPGCTYTINKTFTDTTVSGPVSGSVVYNGTTYFADPLSNNLLLLTLTPTAGPLPATYTPGLPAQFGAQNASGAFTMTGTITLMSSGNTIFTEAFTGTGQVSVNQLFPCCTGNGNSLDAVFTFATPEPTSRVLMSSGLAALFLCVTLKRRGISRRSYLSPAVS